MTGSRGGPGPVLLAVLVVVLLGLFVVRAPAEDAPRGEAVPAPAGRPLPGQVAVSPRTPRWLVRHGEGPLFLCGPGDPEDFLYRGCRLSDGTRDGDQERIIERLAATGANALYVQAVRSHGGDGDRTHHPFRALQDAEPDGRLDPEILAQWDEWLGALEEAGVVVLFFVYDDSALVWDTGDAVCDAERRFLHALVDGLEHRGNIIWCVAEEWGEALSAPRVAGIAREIGRADDHRHPIAVHRNDGLDFEPFADDPWIDQFAIQWNRPTAGELHRGVVRAWEDARGRYNLNLSEAKGMGTGAELREKLWASALGGAYVMVLDMDVVSTSRADLEACARLARFLEATPLERLGPRDGLAAGDARWALAASDRSAVVLYAPEGDGPLAVDDLPEGRWTLRWLDAARGTERRERGVAHGGGAARFPRPEGIGAEAALHIAREDGE